MAVAPKKGWKHSLVFGDAPIVHAGGEGRWMFLLLPSCKDNIFASKQAGH